MSEALPAHSSPPKHLFLGTLTAFLAIALLIYAFQSWFGGPVVEDRSERLEKKADIAKQQGELLEKYGLQGNADKIYADAVKEIANRKPSATTIVVPGTPTALKAAAPAAPAAPAATPAKNATPAPAPAPVKPVAAPVPPPSTLVPPTPAPAKPTVPSAPVPAPQSQPGSLPPSAPIPAPAPQLPVHAPSAPATLQPPQATPPPPPPAPPAPAPAPAPKAP